MKKLSIIAAVAVAGLALAGCSSDSNDEANNDNGSNNETEVTTIKLSTGTQFPPMGYIDENGDLIGFDIDLGNAIAEEAGYEIQWEESVFNQFLSDVNSERTDGLMGAMLDTPERQESLNFIDYMESGFQFYTTTDAAEANDISEIEDLCGLTVAASRNSSYAGSINEWSAENCDGNDITVLDTDGSPDALLQLKQGRAQAAMQTNETIAYMASNDDTIVPLGKGITSSFYGLGFSQDDEETLEAFKTALETVIENGTYAEIAEKWGLEDQAIDKVTINLEGR